MLVHYCITQHTQTSARAIRFYVHSRNFCEGLHHRPESIAREVVGGQNSSWFFVCLFVNFLSYLSLEGIWHRECRADPAESVDNVRRNAADNAGDGIADILCCCDDQRARQQQHCGEDVM